MDIAGPISRTVEDCALTLQAIAGHDPRDPYTTHGAVPDYRAGLTGDLKGLRIGIIKEAVEADFLQPQVKAAVMQAITALETLGATLVEVVHPHLAVCLQQSPVPFWVSKARRCTMTGSGHACATMTTMCRSTS